MDLIDCPALSNRSAGRRVFTLRRTDEIHTPWCRFIGAAPRFWYFRRRARRDGVAETGGAWRLALDSSDKGRGKPTVRKNLLDLFYRFLVDSRVGNPSRFRGHEVTHARSPRTGRRRRRQADDRRTFLALTFSSDTSTARSGTYAPAGLGGEGAVAR